MYIDKLLEISGPSLTSKGLPLAAQAFGIPAHSLNALLQRRNGFYSFESALHVFPADRTDLELGLSEWNSRELWISRYGDLADNCFFFAEDIFGGQFCFYDNQVYSFDPETGDKEYLASDLEDWAQLILSDYDYLTGYSLGHGWQERNGQLKQGMRLIPKVPFVAGGEFSTENLYAIGCVQGMQLRGSWARQVHNLPDGAQIEIKIVE